jgi:DNA-binding phage protein
MKMMKQLIEYIKIHLISLNQDYEKFYDDYLNDNNYDPADIDNIRGQIKATRHLLSVAEGMIE